MEKSAPRNLENKFSGRNFTYKSRQSKFEGQIDALKGHIYDFTDNRQADLYTTTTKDIAGYAAITLKNGSDVRKAIEDMTVRKFT